MRKGRKDFQSSRNKFLAANDTQTHDLPNTKKKRKHETPEKIPKKAADNSRLAVTLLFLFCFSFCKKSGGILHS